MAVDPGRALVVGVLHDYFGRGANEVMHRLTAIRRTAKAGA